MTDNQLPVRTETERHRWSLAEGGDVVVLLNEIDRLRAIEAAARALLTALDADDAANIHGWSAALRAALEGPSA